MPAVTRFKRGDAVFGYRGQDMACTAEYVTLPADGLLAPKPANLSDEKAAAIPYGALTALSLLKKAAVHPGQRVLIYGASGSIGAAALQLAKLAGAHVTAVCGPARQAMVVALGADQVLDYTKEDFAEQGQQYDLILDVLGKHSFARSRKALTPDGRYIMASFKLRNVLQMLWTSIFSRQKVVCALVNYRQEDLAQIAELLQAGKLRAIVDRSFPLAQTAEAHRYMEAGNRTGAVVIAPL